MLNQQAAMNDSEFAVMKFLKSLLSLFSLSAGELSLGMLHLPVQMLKQMFMFTNIC